MFKGSIRAAALAVTCLLVAFICTYLFSPGFIPAPKSPFTGGRYANPYASLREGRWFKANFHAHSDRCGGKQPPCEVVSKYREMGFSIAGVSDHNMTTDTSACSDMYVPVYEHGFGVKGRNYTAINCEHTIMEWFPLFQGVNQKQMTLNRLRGVCSFIAINHPGREGAFTPDDFDLLDGYNAVEIFNYKSEGTAEWDRALSAGRLIWGFAGDDSHDAAANEYTGTRHIMINSPSLTLRDIIFSFRQGLFEIVKLSVPKGTLPHVKKLYVEGNVMRLVLDSAADEIRFIGQGGVEAGRVSNTSDTVYEFRPADTYIRIEIYRAGNASFLNPVLRYDR